MSSPLSLKDFLVFATDFNATSTADFPRDRTVVMVKSSAWLHRLVQALANNELEIMTMCAWDLYREVGELPDWFTKRARPVFFDDVTQEFIRFHNIVNANRQPEQNKFAATAKCHPTVVIGIEGMRYFCGPDTEKPMAMKHMGNVVIGEDVEIGPYTVIHRGTIGSTVICSCAKIGSFVNIGHNVTIGMKTAITPFVCIGGSTRIGKNCWIGMHSVIRDNITICEGVKIGMGSQVIRDIQEPGLYFGSPATRKGDWDGVW